MSAHSRKDAGMKLSDDIRPLLTVQEVAALTRLSRSEIYALIGRGDLVSVRPPGCTRVLVDPADLRAYLVAGRTAGPAVGQQKI